MFGEGRVGLFTVRAQIQTMTVQKLAAIFFGLDHL